MIATICGQFINWQISARAQWALRCPPHNLLLLVVAVVVEARPELARQSANSSHNGAMFALHARARRLAAAAAAVAAAASGQLDWRGEQQIIGLFVCLGNELNQIVR